MTSTSQMLATRVLVIGGGATGTGLARDLALRGIDVILAEKKDINAGASGGNHGLLHSGARYAASDTASAVECRREGEILKRLSPQCIENTGGLFAAVTGDDENYVADFPGLCEKNGIPVRPVDIKDAKEMEPALSEHLIAAYHVPDAVIDPFRLSLDNMAHARQLGARIRTFHQVISFEMSSRRITAAVLQNRVSGERLRIEADVVVNAAGAWAAIVAGLAGADIPMHYSKGSLLVTQQRHARRVVNRLRKAADADIVVPGGTVSILGTTSVRVDSPDRIFPEIDEVDMIIDECAAMMPVLHQSRYVRAYCGVRPLFGSSSDDDDDRNVSRGFSLIDHEESGCDNFFTITGGKLTTFRLMAEKAADRICECLGVDAACQTRDIPLPANTSVRWTEPGLAPGVWMNKHDTDDHILCECEMVPKSAIDAIVSSFEDHMPPPSLTAIGLRSRVGKGPCQGAFCSRRIAAYLGDTQKTQGAAGLNSVKAFLQERWRGQHPILWDLTLVQAELTEALHCNLFGLDLIDDAVWGNTS